MHGSIWRRGRSAGAALTAAALLAACGGASAQTPGRTATPSATASVSPAPTATPSPEQSCAARVLAGMSEPQRVGQLILLGLAGDRLGTAEINAIRNQHVGNVWFVQTTTAGVGGVRAVADAVQAQSSDAATARVGFFVAANQEGGQVQALRGSGFSTIPPATTQGTMDPTALQGSALVWGRELRAAGVNLNFAPVLDVVPPGTDAQNQPIGVLQREYGHDPATAGSHGAAFLRGLQQAGVASTIKHFPGLGRVQGNTDFTAGVVDRTTGPADPFLQSFQQGIDAEAPFVMLALATYTRIDADHLAVFSPAVMRSLLRDGMRFRGVVMSDDMGATTAVAAVPAGTRATAFIAAGGDLIVSKTVAATVAMVSALLARADADAPFRTLVDASALRVLQAKQAYGLLPC